MIRLRLTQLIVVTSLMALVVGCSDNPAARKRYELEKQAYEASRLADNLQVRPDLAQPEQVHELDQAYINLVGACYEALDSSDAEKYPDEYRHIEQITFGAVTRLSQFKFAQRRFDSCAFLMDEMLRRVHMPAMEQMLGYYNLGRALQAGGHWDSALTVYDAATNRFVPPVDRSGEIVVQIFNLPLHLYFVTHEVGSKDEAEDRFHKAEEYYTRFLNDYPDTKLEISSNANLARLFELAGMYQKAIDRTALLTDSTGQVNPAARLRMANLFADGLHKYSEAISLYDVLIDEMAAKDSVLAATALYKKAEALMAMGKYSDSRQELIQLDRQYPMLYRGLPIAQLIKAQTFEQEDNWNRAETEYRYLIENYRGTDAAMSTYLHLIKHYSDTGMKQRAAQLSQRAEEYYDQVINTMRGSPREAAALSYKAELYLLKKDWQTAAATLASIYGRFSTTDVGRKAALAAADLYRNRLEEPEKADSLLNVMKTRLTESSQTLGQ